MKTLVIGGGMSGLTYATVALKNGWDVTLAERNARVGKKISMTGNGRCNIGNEHVSPACYNRSSVVSHVLDVISVEEYKLFLNSCGIFTYTDGDGRMYPLSDSASNVVDCFRHQISKQGGRLLTDTVVSSVQRSADGFDVTMGGKTEHFDRVVLACGSGSQAEPTNAMRLVSPAYFTPVCPSLVPVRVMGMDGSLNGLRTRAKVTLWDGDKQLACETGEVQFKDYGLSGICVLNLSALIARREVQRKSGDYRFDLDVVPDMTQWQLEDVVHRRLLSGERNKLFYGILHNKLAEHIVRRAGTHANAAQIAHLAKNLPFRFDRLLDYSMSQVTAGGIASNNVDIATLQLPSGVVALGEVLDVDGICGGYNLFFAAASALYTFTAAQRAKAYSIS